MSTKIYNAYEFVGSDMSELIECLNGFRYAALRKSATVVAESMSSRELWGDEEERDNWRSECVFRDKFKALADSVHAWDTDGLLSVSVIPLSDVVCMEGRLTCTPRYFIIVFGGLTKWFCSLLDNHELFKDFHYQDQTDWPDGISDYEWGERKRVWTEIMGRRGETPALMGPTYDIVGKDMGGDVFSMLRIMNESVSKVMGDGE